MRLTESELTNLIKRIVNEDVMENSLYNDIMDLIRNSNSSHGETIGVLNSIIDEMESSRRVRRGAEKRFRHNMNEEEEIEPKRLSFDEWADVWLSLREQYGETFLRPDEFGQNRDYPIFTGMNMDFLPENGGEYLQVMNEYRNPRNWRDDYDKGIETLLRIEDKLRDRIENSDAGLRFESDDKFRFRIYKK